MYNTDICQRSLCQIRQMDLNYFTLSLRDGDREIDVVVDVLLHVMSYLRPNELVTLSSVCKAFWGLCYSNYVWRSKIFDGEQGVLEETMKLIYNHNKYYFLSYYYFEHYVGINCRPDGRSNYLQLVISISKLVPDLRAPYYHDEIISEIKCLYVQMLKEGAAHEEFVYGVKPVQHLPMEKVGIWKFSKKTAESEFLLVLKKKNNVIKFDKYIRPYHVPWNIIRRIKILFYAETLNRLLGISPALTGAVVTGAVVTDGMVTGAVVTDPSQ